MQADSPTAIPLDRVVQARQAIKDARTVKRHAWEAVDLELEGQQQRLDTFMLERLNQQGATSIATPHGTVYRTLKLKPSAADWGAIWEWAVANDGFEIVEKRLKATFIKEYMDGHDGAIPPGINVHRQYEVAVRRPNERPEQGTSE